MFEEAEDVFHDIPQNEEGEIVRTTIHRSSISSSIVGIVREWSAPSKQPTSALYHYLNKREYVWRLVFFASTCFGVFLIEKIYIFHTEVQYDGIAKTELSDFLWSLLVVGLIIAARLLVKHFLTGRIAHLLRERKNPSKTLRDQQVIGERIVSIAFYVVMSLWGYDIIQDLETRWNIKSYEDLFTEERYMSQLPNESSLKLYYVVQIGYHWFFFLQAYIWNLEHRKYYEWLLHHGIALLLLFYSYMFNLLVVGLYVLFWHHISDLGLVIARTYTLMKWRSKGLTYALYLCEYVLWVYSRNYVFPFQIIWNAIANYHVVSTNFIFAWPVLYLILLMVSLAAMHLYWTYYITQAMLYMVIEGLEYNSYDDKD